MLRFPIGDLLDECACHDFLLHLLHPAGLACRNGHPLPPGQAPHDRHRAPIADYRCRRAAPSSTSSPTPSGPRAAIRARRSSSLPPTRHRPRHTHQTPGRGTGHRSRPSAGTPARYPSTAGAAPFPPRRRCRTRWFEADELYQNAGEKGIRHPDPRDPPRRRANKRRGHGTFANDRPPIAGVVGRHSGRIHLQVCQRSDRATLEAFVTAHTRGGTIVNTDEWQAYGHLAATGRPHRTVCHAPGIREWARDDDGDRGARSPLQHVGGGLDGLPELPAAIPRRQQVDPEPVRGGLRMEPQPQGGDGPAFLRAMMVPSPERT